MLKILLISVPILFAVGSLLHFAYNFAGKNKIIGMFTPVNESVFEHSKLLLIPLLFFWIGLYIFIKNEVNINNYFLAMLISIITSIVVMISFYYTYKEIIGKFYLLIDIFDLFLSLFIGQLVANHFYVYVNGFSYIISLIIIFMILMLYIYLTIKPFNTPFFLDKKNKTYGIKEEKKS